MAWSDAARAAALESRRLHAVHARVHGWPTEGEAYWFKKYRGHVKAARTFKRRGEPKDLKAAATNLKTARALAARYRLK